MDGFVGERGMESPVVELPLGRNGVLADLEQ